MLMIRHAFADVTPPLLDTYCRLITRAEGRLRHATAAAAYDSAADGAAAAACRYAMLDGSSRLDVDTPLFLACWQASPSPRR